MNREAKILAVAGEIETIKKNLASKIAELHSLKIKKEYSTKELINEYESADSEIVTSVYRNDKFEFILGGDGRSAPWSETRTGKVLRINIDLKLVYVQEETLEKFVGYAYAVDDRKIDAIILNGTQWRR